MTEHGRIWQQRDGVYGVQYMRSGRWGIVLELGMDLDAAWEYAYTARYATTRLVRREDGRWRAVPNTTMQRDDAPTAPVRTRDVRDGHADRIGYMTRARALQRV